MPTFSIRSLKINELDCSVCPYCEGQAKCFDGPGIEVAPAVFGQEDQMDLQSEGTVSTVP